MIDKISCKIDIKPIQRLTYQCNIFNDVPRRCGSVVKRVGLSCGRSWVHTKDHHKNGTNCLPALHACAMVGV